MEPHRLHERRLDVKSFVVICVTYLLSPPGRRINFSQSTLAVTINSILSTQPRQKKKKGAAEKMSLQAAITKHECDAVSNRKAPRSGAAADGCRLPLRARVLATRSPQEKHLRKQAERVVRGRFFESLACIPLRFAVWRGHQMFFVSNPESKTRSLSLQRFLFSTAKPVHTWWTSAQVTNTRNPAQRGARPH